MAVNTAKPTMRKQIQRQNMYAYVDGNTARKLQPQQPLSAPKTSRQAKRNRERQLEMNLGYVFFLTVAAIITVFMCVSFLKLRAVNTKLQKEVTVLEARLDSAVLENASDLKRIETGINLEQVKDIAINELGMVYPKNSQKRTYKLEDNDYVRQYSDVPTE